MVVTPFKTEVMLVEMKPEQLFAFLESAYRNQVLDKLLPCVGLCLDGLKARSGMTMDQLLDKLDGAQPDSLEKFDRFLGLMSPLMVVAKSDLLMKLLGRLLNFRAVQKLTALMLEWYFARTLAKSEGTLPPLAVRLKALPARILARKPLAKEG
jgi:hypothetical protein